ncbi:MAG TPA: hypothetical protein VNI34_05415 [Candidatus Nitrosotalea sp.]|nr:hypothetical protein [Candidatus Nitrosotalea sp.]
MRQFFEFQTDAGMVSGAIRPPRGKTFLRRFTRLDPDSPDQIREFADDYGSLANPLGDPFELWRQEIAEVRDLAGTLDEAASAVLYDPGPTAALANRFRHLPYEETLAAGPLKTKYLRHVALSRRLMGRRFDNRVVVYTYGLRMVPFEPGRAARLGYRELGTITDGVALVKATRAFVRFARLCVQEAIEWRLWGAHVGVIYDYAGRIAQPPRIVPATLLGALYLELDRELRTKPRQRPARPLQPCAWGPCLNWLEPTRTNQLFCSNTCVQRAKRQRDSEEKAARGAII